MLGCRATPACCCSALVGAVCGRAPPSCFRMLEIRSASNVAPQYVHRHFSIRHMHTYITRPYAELFINRETQTACKAGKAVTVLELGMCPFPVPGTGPAQPTNPEALLNLPALLRAKSTLLRQRLGHSEQQQQQQSQRNTGGQRGGRGGGLWLCLEAKLQLPL